MGVADGGTLVVVWLSDRRYAGGFRIRYLRNLEEAKELVKRSRNVVKVSLNGEFMDKETFLSGQSVVSGG